MSQNTADQIAFELLAIAIFILCLIYLMIALACSTKLCRIYKSQNEDSILARVFYMSIIFSCIAYLTSMILLLFFIYKAFDEQNYYTILLNDTIYIPDAIFWVMYLTLYWKEGSNLVIYRVMNSLKIINLVSPIWNPQNNKGLFQFKLIIFIYSLFQIAFILTYNIFRINNTYYIISNIIVNSSIPISLVISEIYLNFKFSGSPFRSKNFEKKTGNQIFFLIYFAGKLNRLLVFWAILRLLQITLNIMLLEFSDKIKDFLMQTDSLSVFNKMFMVCLYVGDLILVSVVPFILAIQNTFIKIFLSDESNLLLLSKVQSSESDFQLKTDRNDDRIAVIETKLRPQFNNSADSSKFERKMIGFKSTDIVYETNQQNQKQGGFGKISFGTLKPINNCRQYAFREIELQQMSTYILEEIEQNIKIINELKYDYIGHIYGWVCEQNKIIFMLKKYENGSLQNLIFGQNNELFQQQLMKSLNLDNKPQNRLEMKIILAIQIARGIDYIHNQNIIHGHLSLNNIMISKQYRAIIVDFGFLPLKKYCSLMIGYQNKSYYTAPEILNERGAIVSNPTKEGDIYSFGMILYEIFIEKVPFKDVSLKEIQQIVTTQNVRPKIDEKAIGEDIATIIRLCWQQDPTKRPSMDKVVQAFENIKESIE